MIEGHGRLSIERPAGRSPSRILPPNSTLTGTRPGAYIRPAPIWSQLAGALKMRLNEWLQTARHAVAVFSLEFCSLVWPTKRVRGDLRGSLHRVTNAKALKAKALCPNFGRQEGPTYDRHH